jgi:hypothetical protein
MGDDINKKLDTIIKLLEDIANSTNKFAVLAEAVAEEDD